MPEEVVKKTWKFYLLKIWREYTRPFLFVLIVFTAFRSSIADWNDVPTGSMRPTILEGDRIFVNKLAYDLKVPFTTWRVAEWSDPQRGDVVVCFSPADGKRLVKRIVAIPGDTVQMINERLLINGSPVQYDAIDPAILDQLPADEQRNNRFVAERLGSANHPVMVMPHMPAMRSFGPIKISEDHYFLMGDNRDNSLDSRYFGTVERSLIVGRASAVVASVDREDYYLPRWKRFFTTLP
jgi:signal peptidase I